MAIAHATFLLDQGTWDLCLDASGNLAVANAPYSIAQDVASQLKTFLGECWYDTSQGVPYWQSILGKRPPTSYVVAALESQALLVPDVQSVAVTIGGLTAGRAAVGQALVTDADGNTTSIAL